MRTLPQSSKLILGASLFVTVGLPLVSGAAGFPFTYSGPTAQWNISDNVAPSGGPVSGGLGFSDADFNDASKGLDAYDGAFALKINGVGGGYFVAPAAATLTGNAFDSTVVDAGAYTIQVKYTFFQVQNLPVVRAIYAFTAKSSVAALDLNWDVNLGSDLNTKIEKTSTANVTTIDQSTRWFVSSDNGLPAPGDLINTIVRYGANFTERPRTDSIIPPGGSAGKDLLSDHYMFNVPANQTSRLMMFGVLGSKTDGAVAATTFAATFDSYQNMLAAGLFDGTDTDRQNIINWGVVPEPGALAFLTLGFGILLRKVRRR